MQIQILKPAEDGKYYPNYNELIKNARDDDERKYLKEVKARHIRYKKKGMDYGYAFGMIYTAKMACGHYELFQHPIYRDYGKEPTEENIANSIREMLDFVEHRKADGCKCTRCICGW